MCHRSYLCYLGAVKLEAFAHRAVRRLKGKPVLYGVGGARQICPGHGLHVFDLTEGRPRDASVA